ncbi:MAG: SDR family oxidoreductase [Phycisphaerales bacterium]|nr:SDR family oxidoreductase [Phycisphaerales bacterium]
MGSPPNGAPGVAHPRVYMVLGATGGIGSALARRLAACGAKLVLAARDRTRLDTLADQLGALAIHIDATRLDHVDACFDRALERTGRIDGVANCVGSLLLKPAHLTTQEELAGVLAANLGSAFATVRAAGRTMRQTGGAVVLVSSAAARVGLANHEAIAAAKAAVEGLTLSAAATYAPYGIRINAVAPGLTRTPLTHRLTSNEASLRASAAMHALGRIGEPDDVAASIAWLLSDDSAWITGQVLGVDGGLATLRAKNSR